MKNITIKNNWMKDNKLFNKRGLIMEVRSLLILIMIKQAMHLSNSKKFLDEELDKNEK